VRSSRLEALSDRGTRLQPAATRWARFWRHASPYGFVLPFYAVFALFTLWPLAQNVITSFQRVDLGSRVWIGLRNYQSVINDPVFWKAVQNTLALTAVVVPLVIFLGLSVALVAHHLSRVPRNVFRMAFYLPTVASATVISIIFLWILNPVYGLLNYLIGFVGIAPVAWLGEENTALFGVALVVLTFSLGVPIILFMAGLDSIPLELREAARLDGATRVAELRHIILPLLSRTTALVLITATIHTFQVFTVVQLLTLGGPANATQTIVYRIYEKAFAVSEFGVAAAMSCLLMALGYAIAVIQMRFVSREITY
jgi:multiple sugar transport system permease protein